MGVFIILSCVVLITCYLLKDEDMFAKITISACLAGFVGFLLLPISVAYSSNHKVITKEISLTYFPIGADSYKYVADTSNFTEIIKTCDPTDNFWLYNISNCSTKVILHTTNKFTFYKGEQVMLVDLK